MRLTVQDASRVAWTGAAEMDLALRVAVAPDRTRSRFGLDVTVHFLDLERVLGSLTETSEEVLGHLETLEKVLGRLTETSEEVLGHLETSFRGVAQ
jgi:hypothetical protein